MVPALARPQHRRVAPPPVMVPPSPAVAATPYPAHGTTALSLLGVAGVGLGAGALLRARGMESPTKLLAAADEKEAGGPKGAAAEKGAPPAQAEAAPPPKPPKKPRLPALDSIRFALILYIACGHFVQMCVTNVVALKLLTQVNVVVGAFFVLSGYVAGYTGTVLGRQEAEPRVNPPGQYIVGKVLGFYPLHLLVLLLFGPMFFYADMYYNGALRASAHGLMSLTLTQAWFPLHAEVWNAPTWFLSAMAFATAALPASLTALAPLGLRGLRLAGLTLTTALLLPRLAYSYDLGVWGIMEGLLNARTHPNIAYWNTLRFHPFYALLEMLLGVVACRTVMLDPPEAAAVKPQGLWGHLTSSPVWPLLGMGAVLLLRATDVLGLNDPLTRSLLFLPLFTHFLVTSHRQTLRDTPDTPSLTRLMAWKPLTYLGTISFPIFVLHGPLGQLMYKKVIASHFAWAAYASQPWFFALYLSLSVAGGALLHWGFVARPWVAAATRAVGERLLARLG